MGLWRYTIGVLAAHDGVVREHAISVAVDGWSAGAGDQPFFFAAQALAGCNASISGLVPGDTAGHDSLGH
jgi:hypothetical protein